MIISAFKFLFNNGEYMSICKIAIIDSGLECDHQFFVDINIVDTLNLISSSMSKDITDRQGHGTAITGIIYSKAKLAQYVIIKIYDIELETTEDILIKAIEYAYENGCNLIHLSLGNDYYSEELERCCKCASQAGAIIVSAYSNDGGISYPAHLQCVVGVQSDELCKKSDDFLIPKDGIVDVCAKGGLHRVPWINAGYAIQQGNSFSAAYLSSLIAQQGWYNVNKKELLYKLRQYILKKKNEIKPYIQKTPSLTDKNSKIAVFPYNKEIKTLINLDKYLSFNITQIYVAPESGSIGRMIMGLKKEQYELKSIHAMLQDKINWLIIGHLNEYEKNSKLSKRKLLQLCLINRINVFSLDDSETERFAPLFQENGLALLWPQNKVLENKNNKLYNISKPVIAICGTNSKQGKFHAQVFLRELFKKDGYKVCQLATEPIGYLFQMEEVVPFGYASSFQFSNYEFIDYINSIMYRLELKAPDVIITGSQSGTVPENFCNLGYLPMRQLEFILGTHPDIVVLCVSMKDDIQYIERTIKGIEGLSNARVVAILLFPFIHKNGWNYLNENFSIVDRNELTKRCDILTDTFKLPTSILYNLDSIKPIYYKIINILSEDSI